MSASQPSALQRGLERWGAFLARHPRQVIAGTLLLAALSVPFAYYTLSHLDADLFNQVSDRLPRFRVLRDLSTSFGGDILAAVAWIPDGTSGDEARVVELKAFGELLVAELAQAGIAPGDAEDPDAKDLDAAGGKPVPGPWLRQVECRAGQGTREALLTLARENPHAVLAESDVAVLRARFEKPALEARLKEIRELLPRYDAQGLERRRLLADPLDLADLGEQALAQRFRGRHGPALQDADGYYLSLDRTTLLVLARPIRSAKKLPFNRALMAACQRAENRAVAAFRARSPAPKLNAALKGAVFGERAAGEPEPRLACGFTGLHAISVENEAALRYDILQNTATAGLFVLAIYLVAYRRARLALCVILTLGLAVIFTLALTWPLHGAIGVLGAGFTAILIGMGEDYAIYLHNTFHGLWAGEGLAPDRALGLALARCGPSILAAAAAAGVAFFAVATTQFRGLAELGLLAGLGLTISALLMLSFFPALMLGDTHKGGTEIVPWLGRALTALGRLHASPRGRACALLSGLLTAGAALALLRFGPDPGPEAILGARFDGDFGNLRSLRIQAIPLRDRVAKRFGQGIADIRVLAEADSERAALGAAEAAAARLAPYVERGELTGGGGILDLLPPAGRQERSLRALQALDLGARAEDFRAAAQAEFGPRAETVFAPFLERLREWAEKLRSARPVTLEEVLRGPLGAALATCARIEGEGAARRFRLVSYYFPTNLHFPESWYNELARTVEERPPEGAALSVTAARMVGFELKHHLFSDMAWITGVVGLAVTLLILLTYRSPRRALLAALPLTFGYLFVLATVQAAQALGWDLALNYVNLMVFPLLLGTGIDYGIYLVSDAGSERRPGVARMVGETGLSVFVACLTTLAGFGSMIFSNYTGLVSFGWIALLGYGGTLFGALVVLPALLSKEEREGAEPQPGTHGPPALVTTANGAPEPERR